MAFATKTQLIPTTAFQGQGRIRAAGVPFEAWLGITAGGVTTGTITCAKITVPQAVMVFDNADASVVTPATTVITPNASGTSTVAFTGLTASSSYTVWIRGGI